MKKILVVDDLAQNVYMLEVLLTTNGYLVDKASNGIEALEIIGKEPPDLIISDILMPGMDGFSFCRTCKSDEKFKRIPFIFYTATYVDPKDAKLALDIGADRYVVKPIEPDELLAIINDSLEKHITGGSESVGKTMAEEKIFFKEYNEALIRKLEDKMLDLQRANKRLSSLYKASCDMLVIRSTPDLVQLILKAIVETAGYEEADFFEFNEKTNELVLLAIERRSQNHLRAKVGEFRFQIGDPKGIVGMVARQGTTTTIDDTEKDPNWITIDPSIHSALYAPVQFEKKLLGVVGLFAAKANSFGEDDARDIAALANNLAVAIVNASNMQTAQRQLTRISSLHNIDMAINSSLDLKNTLDIVLKHVIGQLKVDAADILLCHQGDEFCEFSTGRGFKTGNPDSSTLRIEKNLAKKVVLDRRLVQLNDISEDQASHEFLMKWNREGFKTYIGVPLVAAGMVNGVLEVFFRSEFNPDQEWCDFLITLAGQAAIAVDKGQIFEGLQRSNFDLVLAYDATIKGWSRALDIRDQETEGHTQRVTELTIQLAEIMGMTGDAIIQIQRGALLHDIGKLGVPDSILLKPGPLTDGEWEKMRKHPQIAYDLLKPITYLASSLDIPYCHHERWDGSGYPRGLKGEEIPLTARLFAVVDVYDALCSGRPYRTAWPKDDVIGYIREQSGKHFDPAIAEIFLKTIAKKDHR